MITNGWSGGMWKKALKNGAAVSSGVLLDSIIHPAYPLYSKAWFCHAGLAAVTVFLVTELSYIRNWWSNGDSGTPQKV